MSQSDTSGVTKHGALFVPTSVNYPRLLRTDPDSIRDFLRLYDQKKRTVLARAAQITVGDDSITTEAVRTNSLKFCVDSEYPESAIALKLITGATSYEALTDTVLRSFLNKEEEDSKGTISLQTLEEIVERELRMYMGNESGRSRMQSPFIWYHSLFWHNGLSWILEDNQKVAVGHVLYAVRPKNLQERLESNLRFSKTDCRKDFSKFMEHGVQFSGAFQILDNCRKQSKHKQFTNRHGKKRGGGGERSHQLPRSGPRSGSHCKSSDKPRHTKRTFPDCPYIP